MRQLTEKQKRWMWFGALWLGGLCAALGISYAVRGIIKTL